MNRRPIAVTGRFQPLHLDHLELIHWARRHAPRVFVGITNAEASERRAHPSSAHRHLSAANPFSYAQRVRLIEAALAASGIDATSIRILAFPLESPQRWAELLPAGTRMLVRVHSDWEREKVRRFEAAGWPTVVLEGDPRSRLSASAIRAAFASGAPWAHWVPPGARELLCEWVREGLGGTTDRLANGQRGPS